MTSASKDYVIRPVRESDLEELFRLAREAGPGMTTLPDDRELLEQRIRRSLQACRSLTEEPQGETYLFVAEDSAKNEIAGVSGMVSRLGGFQPFYAYRVIQEHHETETPELESRNEILTLVEDHDGPCELNSLFVHPDHRGSGLGTLLSRVRFLYIGEYPDRFDSTIIAELRGRSGEDGPPPFWRGVTAHFIPLDFREADAMTLRDKQFIEDLMPDHPIYLSLLPDAVRDVIGGVHSGTEPAAGILRGEGFEPTDLVDIFDAGMIVSCNRESIRTIKNSSRFTLDEPLDSAPDDSRCLIAGYDPGFRATRGGVELVSESTCRLPVTVMDKLSLSPGDTVRVSPVDFEDSL